MSIIFLLIPLALAMFALAACMFVWAVRHQQFEDLDSPAARILFDDDVEPASRSRGTPPPARLRTDDVEPASRPRGTPPPAGLRAADGERQ